MKKKLSMQVQESASIEEQFQQFLSASAANCTAPIYRNFSIHILSFHLLKGNAR